MVASAVSVAEAVATVVAAAEEVAVVVPSTFGFDGAAPPLPPFPFVPLGGDDLRDEDEFAVKYLYLFPFPSPPPPDLEEKNEKARTCCREARVVVDVDVATAVEASETVGRVATSRANIFEEIQGVRRKRVVRRRGSHLPTFSRCFQKRNVSHSNGRDEGALAICDRLSKASTGRNATTCTRPGNCQDLTDIRCVGLQMMSPNRTRGLFHSKTGYPSGLWGLRSTYSKPTTGFDIAPMRKGFHPRAPRGEPQMFKNINLGYWFYDIQR